MHLIKRQDLKIPENRQRTEFDPDGHVELVESIQKHGLLSALILRSHEGQWLLVAGERRLRAIDEIYALDGTIKCNDTDIPYGMVPYLTLGELSPVAAMQAEFEENVRRMDLTWQERAKAEADLLRLTERISLEIGTTGNPAVKVAEASRGAATTANVTAVTRSVVLSNNLHRPEVAAAKSASEAIKVLQRIDERERNAVRAAALGKEFLGAKHRVLNTTAGAFMATTDQRFDVICTDPPYGMGADEFGDSGGGAAGAHFYDDSPESFAKHVVPVLKNLHTLAKPDAHAYIFCDFDRFHEIKGYLVEGGWDVFRTPLIWVVPTKYRAPWPESGPQRKYETILYAKRGSLKCTKIMGDVLTYPMDENLGHQAQKPVALFQDLLSRSVRPGMQVLDLFAGTGPVIPAAHSLSAIATAVEADPAAYSIAVGRAEEVKG